jgi:transposase
VEEPSKPTVAIAPAPPQIIPKSIATPSLLAHVIVTRFVDAVPFYRQEKQFARLGVDIKRSTMSNWAIALAEACSPLLALLQTEVLAGPLVNCDETTLQVLREPGRKATTKSFIWVFAGGSADKPAVFFLYSPTRHGKVAAEFLQGYSGAVQTDGFDGYNFLDALPEIQHHGCWGHARRKFMDVLKAAGRYHPLPQPRGGVADEMVERIRVLYAVEASAREKELSPADTVVLRQERAKPEVTAIKTLLDRVADEVPPKGLLGKAVNYTRNQWPRLETYLENGHVGLDNNRAENTVRPIVVGRKNFLFAGSPDGAHASAGLYSLAETAKANGLEPYRYFLHIFTQLPRAGSTEEIRSLLPQHLDKAVLGQPP